MKYGILAVGVNQAVLKLLISTCAQNLRKLLRIHEHGVTNLQVLQRARLDLYSELDMQAHRQCMALSTDTGRDVHLRRLEASRAQSNMQDLHQLRFYESQALLSQVLPSQVVPRECPKCGQVFDGQHNLHMHIKHKHPELNKSSRITFSRRDHALFGLPFCRFCRVRCCDWNALEKHATQGMCVRLKAGFAQDKTIETIIKETEAEEQANPPQPPSDALDTRAPLDTQKHIFLTSIHETPKIAKEIRAFRSRCVLCGQRV